jgi:hypothetical protein
MSSFYSTNNLKMPVIKLAGFFGIYLKSLLSGKNSRTQKSIKIYS